VFSNKEIFLRHAFLPLIAFGWLISAQPALADYDLAQKKNCLACHSVDKRKYGPNFQEIAAKYVDDKKAVDKLAKKIRRGGKGVWGADVMPAQPQVSAAEAKTLALYILAVK
jgi:cytochrome c